MASGKIAMKLDEGDRLVRVRTFMEDDDILLFTRRGQCIRFPVAEVRVFSGRTSTGVRGIRLADGDEVINMCGLRHVKADALSREEYLQAVNAKRRLAGSDYSERPEDKDRDEALAARLDQAVYREMAANEEFLLTVSEDGFGKRTSSYEYRISGRGGQGVAAMDLNRAHGTSTTVAAFPLMDTDQIVMITNGGQLIRCGVNEISTMSRKTRGVKLFATGEGESVVSVTRIRDVEDADDESDAADEGDVESGEGPAEGITSENGELGTPE
jgi:DNA gyrase subunit A